MVPIRPVGPRRGAAGVTARTGRIRCLGCGSESPALPIGVVAAGSSRVCIIPIDGCGAGPAHAVNGGFMSYRAPLKELHFAIAQVIGADVLAGCAGADDYSVEIADAVLEEAARLAEGVLDPLYASADREAATWSENGVTTPKGFPDAYRKFAQGGWTQLRAEVEHGGQGLPTLLVSAVDELFAAANLAFRLCPLLTQGAIEAISYAGSEAQKTAYLPALVRGDWTGTMNLTESQAGSDLSALRTRAEPAGDHFRIFGQKIFITYGEHDLAENIIHLVLARIDGAPAGVRGISLFIVPKFLLDADGKPGKRNDLQCVSIEHKLGIRGSPTCTMVYGQGDGAVGYLLGEPNRGLETMFVMMNAARLGVGIEGYALADRAYQRALAWARDRVQGKPAGIASAGPLPIIHHADVRRMLLTMKSQIEAMRYLGLYAAAQLDIGSHHTDAATAAAARARGDLLIPIVKAWSTETGLELCSLGVQIHGGMGFIEDTGAAQSLRDARIGTIYEGTTGIQAADLIGRKLARDGGVALAALLAEASTELAAIHGTADTVAPIAAAATAAVERLGAVSRDLLGAMASDPAHGGAVAVPYLKLAGLTLGGWLTVRGAQRAATLLAAPGADVDRGFLEGKLQSARFYAAQVLPQTLGLADVVRNGARAVLDSQPDLL